MLPNQTIPRINNKPALSYNPDYAIPMGWTLLETLSAIGMSLEQLSEMSCIHMNRLRAIVEGKAEISENEAKAISVATDTPSSFWVNLDRQYWDALARQKHT